MEQYKLELYHHGTKGMKWGRRLYQHKDGSLTMLGRLRYGKKGAPGESKAVSAKREEDVSAKKEKILASRSAKALYKNANLFTTEELNKAYQRLDLEKKIKNLAPEEKSKGREFIDKTIERGNKAAELAVTGQKLYNNIARIRNTFDKTGNQWPIIGTDTIAGMRKKRGEEARKERESAEDRAFTKLKRESEEREAKARAEKVEAEADRARWQLDADIESWYRESKNKDADLDRARNEFDAEITEWYRETKKNKS